MATVGRFVGDVEITGNVKLGSGSVISPSRPRSEFLQENLAVYPIPAFAFSVWDSGQPLPATAASDDLGIYVGTYGTHTLALTAGDVKTLTATRYARAQIQLPPEYVAGETVTIRVSGGMLTTVASTSCTVDIEAYASDRKGAVDGADLCATSAQSINSLTFGDKDFQITPTDLAPGDWLDVRLTIASVDAATGTVVKPLVTVELLADIKG